MDRYWYWYISDIWQSCCDVFDDSLNEILDKETKREAKKGKGHSSSNLEKKTCSSFPFEIQFSSFMNKKKLLTPPAMYVVVR